MAVFDSNKLKPKIRGKHSVPVSTVPLWTAEVACVFEADQEEADRRESKGSGRLREGKQIHSRPAVARQRINQKVRRKSRGGKDRGADEGRGGQEEEFWTVRASLYASHNGTGDQRALFRHQQMGQVGQPRRLPCSPPPLPSFFIHGAGRFLWLKDHPCFGPLGRRSRRYTPNSGEVSMLSDCTRRLRLYATGGAVVGGATCWGAIQVLAARAPMNRMQRWIWTLSGSLIGMGMATSVAGTHSMKQLVSTPNSPLADVARKL